MTGAALPVACRVSSTRHAAAWWQASGWMVTAYGLEQANGHNAIAAERLADTDATGQLRWIGIMDSAALGLDRFLPAFAVALALHGYADVDPALVPVSGKAYRKGLRRMAYEAAEAAKRKKAAAAKHANRRYRDAPPRL